MTASFVKDSYAGFEILAFFQQAFLQLTFDECWLQYFFFFLTQMRWELLSVTCMQAETLYKVQFLCNVGKNIFFKKMQRLIYISFKVIAHTFLIYSTLIM